MAIAVNGGHVSRAIDFYDSAGKYFIIGGTTPWQDESNPDAPSFSDFRLKDVVGLKKVEKTYLVIPHEDGDIKYRSQNWKKVERSIETTIVERVISDSTVITVVSVAGMRIGDKLRIANLYEGVITAITGNQITLDTNAPSTIPLGAKVLGGAQVEEAKYVYVECSLEYDRFPLVTYRQIGLCTKVTPDTEDILLSSKYSASGDQYTSLGILEILDNRPPATRDVDQKELLSLIIEF